MLTSQRIAHLREIEEKLNVVFENKKLLNQALTHSSYVNESKMTDIYDNERLEFLGDAVLKLVVSDHIFTKYPDCAEGALTKMRAAVVSDLSLSETAKVLELGKYILFGKNEKASGGDKKKSNIANALEAIIAAIYMEHGITKAQQVVIDLLEDSITRASSQDFIIDYKSALQELSQKNKWGLPFYKVVKELGPKHKRVFWIEVKVLGSKQGLGKGLSKKEAEQKAAMEALLALKDAKNINKGLTTIIGDFIERVKK